MARVLVRLVLTLLVLAVVVIGADRLARAAVARQVARGLQVSQGLSQPPTVTVQGGPFLPQAVRGRYEQVDVVMTGVPTSGPLVVDRLDATLHGVRAAALPTLQGKLTALPVEYGEAEAFASFTSLQRAANRMVEDQGVRLTLGHGAEDRVAFTARISSLVGTFTVKGQIRVVARGGTVALQLLADTLTGIPSVLRSTVADQVDLDDLVPGLPFGIRATRVVVDRDGLRLQAAGTSLTIPV